MLSENIFKNKKILITGHTGFKGSWLTLWLLKLKAKVIGVSLNTPTKPSLFEILNLRKKIIHKNFDIRNLNLVKKTIKRHKPDFIFHLAAQAIVKKSFIDPVYNWETNTLGTLNILEALRNYKKKCTVIMVTSDKCYKNFEIKRGYAENDILGGDDPYSASKAAAELIINSYVKSFFNSSKSRIHISSVRAGNVIGGGDWSDDRLIPDCIKSWSKQKDVSLRNANSTRPWQHVIEAIRGYLILASNLSKKRFLHGHSFNFGPSNKNNFKVITLVKEMKKNWNNITWKKINTKKKYFESKLLKINSNKAKNLLNWSCILNFNETAKMVSQWYKTYYQSKTNMYEFTLGQIDEYISLIQKNKK